ncbi:MAG: CvpA family protein, partial [Bacilli bacterium]|nr:CvpA family protein [Bacilli bacterium]
IKGFIDEVSAKAGYVFGFIVALMFTRQFSGLFINRFDFPAWFAAFIAYFCLFIITYIVIRILGSVLTNIMDTANLSVIDNIAGFVLGILETFLIIAALEYILGHQNLFNLSHIFEESLFCSKLITPFASKFFGLISKISL